MSEAAFKARKLHQLRLAIKEGNARFAALNAKGKALEMANDVLLQLKSKKLDPQTSFGYFDGPGNLPDEAADLQLALIGEEMPDCVACGIGSMAIARCRLGDGISLDKLESRDSIDDVLGPQVPRIIEHLFEGYSGTVEMDGSGEGLSEEDTDALNDETIFIDEQMPKKALSHDGPLRLRMIMENMVRNNGDIVTATGINLTAKHYAAKDLADSTAMTPANG